MMRFTVALALAGLFAGCATGRSSLGEIRLKPYTNQVAVPAVFSVQPGRILNPALDVAAEPDGCLKGSVNGSFVQVCEKAGGAPQEPGAKTERFTGSGGDFTVELQQNGRQLRMDGYISVDGQSMPMHATIPMGQGPAWDELRQHPGLLAIAAAAAGVEGEPTRNQMKVE